ncbi:T3SS effector HopA1 family protein [Flexivirga sp. B27]
MAEMSMSRTLTTALDDLDHDHDAGTVVVDGETFDSGDEVRFRQALGVALYRAWHSGAAAPSESVDPRRDLAFEELLREATPHRSSRTPAVIRSNVVDGPVGPHVLYDVGRVRVQLPLKDAPQPLPDVGTRTILELPAIRPALSPGFFLVNGSAGGSAGGAGDPTLRVYIHMAESSMAPAVWGRVLQELEQTGVPYRAKVLAKAASYPRRDAIVLYLPQPAWHCVSDVVAALQGLPGRAQDVSLLTTRLDDGVGAAWEPADSRVGWGRMSFGQHRTAAIASGIADHLLRDADLCEAVRSALIEARVRPDDPACNVDSPSVAEAITASTREEAS